MQKLKHIRYLLIAFIFVLTTACGNDDLSPQTEQDVAFALLAGNWTLGNSGSIMVDEQDISLNYPGFSISFTDGRYATLNGGDLFGATGTWTWDDEAAGSITLGDGKEVTIEILTETLFKFIFTLPGTGGAVEGTAGAYVIIVEK